MRSRNRVNCVNNIKEYLIALCCMQKHLSFDDSPLILRQLLTPLESYTYGHRILSGVSHSEAGLRCMDSVHSIESTEPTESAESQIFLGGKKFSRPRSKVTLGVNGGWGLYGVAHGINTQ